jgi:hypothetical protein
LIHRGVIGDPVHRAKIMVKVASLSQCEAGFLLRMGIVQNAIWIGGSSTRGHRPRQSLDVAVATLDN